MTRRVGRFVFATRVARATYVADAMRTTKTTQSPVTAEQAARNVDHEHGLLEHLLGEYEESDRQDSSLRNAIREQRKALRQAQSLYRVAVKAVA